MSRTLVRVLGALWGIASLSCAAQKDTAPPTIHVNQRGLTERIAQTSRGADSSTGRAAPQSAAVNDQGDDRSGLSRVAEQEQKEMAFPGVIRKDPSPSNAGERVEFQRIEAEETKGRTPAPADLDPHRDPRTETFRQRAATRGRQ